MQLDNKVCWEKLNVDLESINTQAPSGTLSIILGINSVLDPSEPTEHLKRKINFMSYEVSAKCEGFDEKDRLNILNDYFFDDRSFQATNLKTVIPKELFIRSVIDKESACSLAVTLLYIHFTNHLDIPLYLVEASYPNIVKWVRSGENNFIDINAGGKILKEQEVLNLVESNSAGQGLDILPPKKLLTIYTKNLMKAYSMQKDKYQQLTCLDILLKLEPCDLKLISQRALLRKDIGMTKEALLDLKRYFSFVEKSQAPSELLIAWHELDPQAGGVIPPSNLLH